MSDFFHFDETLLRLSLSDLCRRAGDVRDRAKGRVISFSPKVFIPLTRLCRDACGYCVYRRNPDAKPPFMELEEVLDLAGRGERMGCREALFVLGERPEDAYPEADRWLRRRGYASSIEYLESACKAVLNETALLPHSNAGTLGEEEMRRLATVNVSLGLMLESTSRRLMEPGGAHEKAPSKNPSLRLAQLEQAGRLGIPFTTGILIGIGETFRERLEALQAIARLDRQYGHIQETIVQNFRRKAGTPMASASEPGQDEMLRTLAQARLILGAEANLQAPPNLARGGYLEYLEAGINDYGGLSPLTFDWVNPEAPWPHLRQLAKEVEERGYLLRPRLAAYPEYLKAEWLPDDMLRAARREVDAQGYCLHSPLSEAARPRKASASLPKVHGQARDEVRRCLEQALAGGDLEDSQAALLLQASGPDHEALLAAADHLREEQCGRDVSYVVNRNINFTNVCVKGCRFCAFSRGFRSRQGYWLPTSEIVRRAREAAEFGCTEICVQAGLPPDMEGDFYVRLCEALKTALPEMHIHAFSPEEVLYGSQRSGRSVRDYLTDLKAAGVGSLPGTSAEILVQQVRDRLAPGRISVEQWAEIITCAHELGIPTTSTIMYGHIETPLQSARHLLLLRDIQRRTGGFSEFVPLSFVSREAPMVRRGLIPESRLGATRREVFNMHAVARLVLGADIANIQASWVKEGFSQARDLLAAGANDLGGTLINESISTSAGAEHGQLATPARLRRLIRKAGRLPVQRDTLYRKLQRFSDPAQDPQEPLDRLTAESSQRFGSYQTLIQDSRFPFRAGGTGLEPR
ncbi:MAG TPA: 5-amino-6-(D-ribitylamino)uracil--L-tyrosine 4-hydroxyphenyl transferase CofH [Acidobacteriota bacterium]|nr:5-amino-6-(D-ribitylamino)uracil--L-tyrosine 4-hydroxyphenyl transferase CofH [Acidobacteriota bacterium]